MKKLFIYYSYSGNGDLVAKYYKERGYETEEIITKEPIPQAKFLAIIIGGFKAMINHQDRIEKPLINLDEFEEVIIGSPIWNDRLSTPVNGFLASYNVNPKAFVLYSASGKSDKASAMIVKNYPTAKIVNIKEPLKYEEEFVEILDRLG